jgi:hypothetical protein
MPTIALDEQRYLVRTKQSLSGDNVDPQRAGHITACHDLGMSCPLLCFLRFLKSGVLSFETMSEGGEIEHMTMKFHVFWSKPFIKKQKGLVQRATLFLLQRERYRHIEEIHAGSSSEVVWLEGSRTLEP